MIENPKAQKLLDALQETAVMLKRMQITCEALEKELRFRLNDRMEIVE